MLYNIVPAASISPQKAANEALTVVPEVRRSACTVYYVDALSIACGSAGTCDLLLNAVSAVV